MSVIDLSTRLTSDTAAFYKSLKSSDSLVYISEGYKLDDGPSSVDLQVGKRCFLQQEGRYYNIPNEGVRLAAFQSILVETAKDVALPFNIFGLVTGKGRLIFKGTFVSTGKIDPGFNGKLTIGLYNGSNEALTLKTGDSLCTCLFLQTESTIESPLKSAGRFQHESKNLVRFWQKVNFWWKRNKDWVPLVTTILSILTVAIAIYKLYIDQP